MATSTPNPPKRYSPNAQTDGWRGKLHEVIFEAETPAGKAFDVALIICIFISIGVVMLDSVKPIRAEHGRLLLGLEWFFTILFFIEYVLRLLAVKQPWLYAKSFYGVVDLLGFLPTFLSLFFPGTRYLTIFRVLRVLRVFRVLKLVHFVGEASALQKALHASGRKIFIFLYTVVTIVVILGGLMYLIEGPENGFTSIPRSIYWAIVTLTTVGYGDIAPQTVVGQMLASFVMILGYGIIAVPTGIVTVELGRAGQTVSTVACPGCGKDGHTPSAKFCNGCGSKL